MMKKTPDLASIISPAPADVLPEGTKPAPDDSKEPVVWADDVSPFTGAQVKTLLDENQRLRATADPTEPPRTEAAPDTVPGIRFVALQNKHRALRALYDEQALVMAGRIAELSRLNAELDAHREALKQEGKTRVFDELMKLARAGGAKHLAFAVTLDDYFPYPSPKDSWVCEAYATESPLSEPIAGGKGRSGEEALRGCVAGLPVERLP